MRQPSYVQQLEEWVFDEMKYVSYRWLSHALSVPSTVAQRMLFDFFERHAQKVQVKYVVTGFSDQLVDATQPGPLGNGLSVRVVDAHELEGAKKALSELLSVQIYSICQKKEDETEEKLKALQATRIWEADWDLRGKIAGWSGDTPEATAAATQTFCSDHFSAIKASKEILRAAALNLAAVKPPPPESRSKVAPTTKKKKPGMFSNQTKNTGGSDKKKKGFASAKSNRNVAAVGAKKVLGGKEHKKQQDGKKSSSGKKRKGGGGGMFSWLASKPAKKASSTPKKSEPVDDTAPLGPGVKEIQPVVRLDAGAANGEAASAAPNQASSCPIATPDASTLEPKPTKKKSFTLAGKKRLRKSGTKRKQTKQSSGGRKKRSPKKVQKDASGDESDPDDPEMTGHQLRLMQEDAMCADGPDMRSEEELERERKSKQRAADEAASAEMEEEQSAQKKTKRKMSKKLVKRTFVDDDGFLVTEEVWEDVADEVDAGAQTEEPAETLESASPPRPSESSQKAAKGKRAKKKKTKKKNAPQKRTMMSFFGKK